MTISNALRFARKRVVFHKSSPIHGAFKDQNYRFLVKPLDALDNIRARKITVYKAASCLGTVYSQIAMSYRLSERPGDMMFVAQSDDDAKEWSVTRGRAFLKSFPALISVMSNDKHAITNMLFQWPHQFLVITGPGVNAQQSKQVRYLHTDEAHVFAPGTLAALQDRMGSRWDRSELHVSTASDEAMADGDDRIYMEIDVNYHEGQQDEWYQMCPRCNRLFWPLWEQYAMDFYGQTIYKWIDSPSQNATLESIKIVCPNCDKEIFDEPHSRYEMNLGGDYVAQNPDHNQENLSFRWNHFAPDWIKWQDTLSKYLKAMHFARQGDITQMQNFTKKVLCMTWRGHIPDLMDAYITGDYKIGDIWIP